MKKLVVPSLEALDLPANLLEGLAENAWLLKECQARIAQRDPWQNAVVAGLVARYGGDASSLVERFMRGEADETTARPRRWARTWSEDQVKTVVWLFQAEVQMMLDLMTWGAEENEESASLLAELCQRRDALDCVRTLLVERKRVQAIENILAVLDGAGRDIVNSLPVVVELHGAWLEAARGLTLDTSGSWWTALVGSSSSNDEEWPEGDPETDVNPPDRMPNPCPRCGEEPCQCRRLGLDTAWCPVCNRDTAFCRCRPPEEEG